MITATWVRRTRSILVAACLVAAGCGGASQAGSPDDGVLAGKLVLTGSSTVAPLANEIAKRFESLHPQVRIDVQTGGSSRGIADARQGLADIGMVSRALKASEDDLQAFTVAGDGIGVIVHSSNPVATLTDSEVVDIYTGAITNWQQVGGLDGPITVVNKAEGRSTLELFLSYFSLSNTEIEPDVVVGDNQQGIKTVAGNPGAIGYVSIGSAEFEAERGVTIKLLPMAGIPASVENVRNGSFPLSRQLNFVTKETPAGLAAAFVDFATSAAVAEIVEGQYFVPITR